MSSEKAPNPHLASVKKIWKFLTNVHQLWWILLCSILGIIAGLFAKDFSKNYLKLLSTAIFLPMLKLIIFPLVFSLLVVGIAAHSDEIKQVANLAWKSILYFVVITVIAIFIGLLWGNVIQPGVGFDTSNYDDSAKSQVSGSSITLTSLLNNIIPESIIIAGYNNKSLQITFCGVMFGICVLLMKNRHERKVLIEFFDAVVQGMMVYIGLVVKFVPIAIGGSLANTVAVNGIAALGHLAKLIGTVYLGLAVLVLVIFLPIALVSRLPWRDFFHAWWKPCVIAFTSASSDAALGLAMENLVAMGCPRDIVGFVMPMGYSFNLDGTTLYLGSALLFVAQANNITLSASDQVIYMFTLVLMSKGIAGLPRASLLVLIQACQSWGMPVNPITAILGVDEIMDMARTSVNLTGNMLAVYVMTRWQGRFREPGWDKIEADILNDSTERDNPEAVYIAPSSSTEIEISKAPASTEIEISKA